MQTEMLTCPSVSEIHALLGERSKKYIDEHAVRVHNSDSGSIFIKGEEVQFAAPKDAIKVE